MHGSNQPNTTSLMQMRAAIATVLSLLGLMISVPATAMDSVPVYGVHEISLTSSNSYSNKYTDVTITATFQGPNRTISIPGFWDGGDTWKIRIAPTETGTWTLASVTSNDSQLSGQSEGTSFEAHQATDEEIAGNEVLRHGFVRVSTRYSHQFEHADGTPFFLISETLWGGRCNLGTHYDTGKFQQIIDNKVSNGFTSINLCNLNTQSSATNEGGPPFNGSYTSESINPAYFQWVDQRFSYMNRQGIIPLIVLGDPNQGFSPNTAWISRFTRYLVARYAAYDVFWFGLKEYEDLGDAALSTIIAYGQSIQTNDPYHHPTSTHTRGVHPYGTSELDGEDWLDFHSMQDDKTSTLEFLRLMGKPVFVAESHYEAVCGYSGPWNYSDPSNLLTSIWEFYLSGGSMGGHFIPCYDIDQYLENMNTTSVAYHKYLRTFFTGYTNFIRLAPRNDLIVTGTGRLLAQESNVDVTGHEYVAFLPNGGTISISLKSIGMPVNVRWYDPTSGDFSNDQSTTDSGTQSFTAPDSGRWVLHLYSDEAGNVAVAPNEPTNLQAD